MKTLRLSWTALSLACLVPLLAAAPQDATKAKATKLDKESLTQKADAQKKSAAQQDFDKLNADMRTAMMAAYKKMREEAQKEREKAKAEGRQVTRGMRMQRPDVSEFAPKFLEAAKKYAGSDDAIMFLNSAIGITKDREVQNQILATLMKDHFESDKLADFVLSLPRYTRTLGAERVSEITEKLGKSPNKAVQAAFLYSEAMAALRARRGQKVTPEAKEAAFDKLRKVVAMAPDASFTGRAKGMLYEAENLQVGMKAPDIVGEDTDGVKFKLSDYSGKVILLDFWGDW